jgi:putative holliday junction resolvase
VRAARDHPRNAPRSSTRDDGGRRDRRAPLGQKAEGCVIAILGLDVGSKRIGLALADPTETFALPLGTIERTNLRADLALIQEYVESYSVSELVVGDPVALSGERGIAAQKMDAFVEALQGVFPGKIYRVDERMTTAQATKTLIAADVSRKDRKKAVDKMAAALILETFLTRRRLGHS